MPNRSASVLLFLSLFTLPLTLLAGGVIHTENFTYPLTSAGKFIVEDANGTITIGSWDRNEVGIIATKQAESQADLDAIRIDIKPESDSIEVRTVYSSPGPITPALPIRASNGRDELPLVRCWATRYRTTTYS
jgi:hypothetical protein